MCESNVYVKGEQEDTLLMEDAVLLENQGGRITVTDILGESKEVVGDIEEITFLEHRIVIKPRS